MFTSAPVLTLSDPKLQFMVEVDASDVGIGAVLSQRSKREGRLHPCAFLSKKLSSAERNYDVGNRELLAIKMVLEELRHWLEGTEQPFLVWMDQWNLPTNSKMPQLSPGQVGSIFFLLSYRSGSKNQKPDTLSRIHSSEPASENPDYILPHA